MLQEICFLGFGRVETLAIATHPLARAVDHLPASCFRPLDRGRNLRIPDVEHVVKEESGPLFRGEPFEQREERDREIVGEVEVPIRRWVRDDGLGQPRAGVGLTLGLAAAKPIERSAMAMIPARTLGPMTAVT